MRAGAQGSVKAGMVAARCEGDDGARRHAGGVPCPHVTQGAELARRVQLLRACASVKHLSLRLCEQVTGKQQPVQGTRDCHAASSMSCGTGSGGAPTPFALCQGCTVDKGGRVPDQADSQAGAMQSCARALRPARCTECLAGTCGGGAGADLDGAAEVAPGVPVLPGAVEAGRMRWPARLAPVHARAAPAPEHVHHPLRAAGSGVHGRCSHIVCLWAAPLLGRATVCKNNTSQMKGSMLKQQATSHARAIIAARTAATCMQLQRG